MFQSMLKKAGQVKISRTRKEKNSTDGVKKINIEESQLISLQVAEESCLRHLKCLDKHDDKDSESNSEAQSLPISLNNEDLDGPTPDPMRSRLSKTHLIDVIHDNYCLSHFVQYVETTGSLVSLKFWMDADNFRIAAQNLEAKHANREAAASSSNHHDSEMERPLTDDEKSELCVKNKKVVDKRSTKSYKTALRDDAFKIYDNYFGYRDLVGLPKSVLAQITSRLQADKAEAAAEAKELNARKDCKEIETKHDSGEDSKIPNQLDKCKNNDDTNSSNVRASQVELKNKSSHEKLTNGLSNENGVEGFTDFNYKPRKQSSPQNNSKPKESNLLSTLFQEAQTFVFQRLERDHLNRFVSSDFFSKYEIEILTDSPTIDDILYSEAALFYFMEYLEQQGERFLLDFYMSAINFQKQHSDESTFCKDAAQKDALILYDKYFSLQAHTPIGMSENVRAEIEQDICAIEEERIVQTFELPRNIVRYYLQKRHFLAFLDSSMFLRYLTELTTKMDHINAPAPVANMNNSSHQLLRRSQSECTSRNRRTKSEAGIASKASRNTLLAMESSCGGNNSKMRSCEGSMQIDSRQLSQPDLLWQRRKSTGDLSFGRVNALGRYERHNSVFGEAASPISMSQPENSKAMLGGASNYGQWSLKRAVRRLVNLTEDDEEQQEVLAWQVAGMIVNDVMSVTMGKKRASHSVSE